MGKLADFVILDKDPTAIDPEKLDTIVVTETIKEGATIYRMGDEKTAGPVLLPSDRSTLALTRAVMLAAANKGHHGHNHRPGISCSCGMISRMSAIMAGGQTD